MRYHFNLGSLFEEVCSENADLIALRYAGGDVTYRQLNIMADRIAAVIAEEGVSQGGVVVIVNTKEPESYAAMIACLKIGAAYANVDRDNPIARFETVLRQCSPALILIDADPVSGLPDLAQKLGIGVVSLKKIMSECTAELKPESALTVTGSRIAYIMFTSGSTGIPKGVAITHQNVLSFINWSTKRYSITPSDVFANISPMYFDNSVFDFYTALFSGASLVPIKKDLLGQPKQLLSVVDGMKCTIWFSVPSMLIYLMAMHALNYETFKYIRIITFGGEGFPKSELKKLYELYRDRITLINVYGPTEGTCICSSYNITDEVFRSMEGLPPLGPMNPNFDCLIFNEAGKTDKEGELCILGPNVGLGYYNDPERSTQAFALCKEHGHYNTPMYRTGDLVRMKDGLLYFNGRKDNQIKHMGYRIELEEIELALADIDGVSQAVVIYERVSDAYGKIIAFVAGGGDLSQNTLRKELKAKLPEYMIPNVIRFYETLPKNPNGKIDKKALRENFRAGS